MDGITEIFGEPISVYTSAQGVEDGFLVAVTARDIVTRSVWERLVAKTPLTAEPPNCWPVEMMGWFRAGSITQKEALKFIAKHGVEAQKKFEEKVRHDKALALARGLIGKYERQAISAEYDRGETFTIYAAEDGEKIRGVEEHHAPDCLQCPHKVMYLRPNELRGCTLMFPEDN